MPENFLPYYAALVTFFLTIVPFIIRWERKRYYASIEQKNRALLLARKINKIILGELELEVVAQEIADIIPEELQFATGILAVFEKEKGVVRRIAVSRTKEAQDALSFLKEPLNQIAISIHDPHNLMALAIRKNKLFVTHDLYDVLGPVVSREEASQIQSIMGTKTTLVYPIYIDHDPLGIFLASTKKRRDEISTYEFEIINNFIDGAGIALRHALLYENLKRITAEFKKANEAVYKKNVEFAKVSEELSLANRRLQEVDELKDEFLALASHELRTPMTVVKSYVWMVVNQKTGPINEKQKLYLERVAISVERLIKLVNDMLDVSRIESGRFSLTLKPLSMRQLVEEVVSEFKTTAEQSGVGVSVQLNAESGNVLADKDKIKQVLVNLIGNSLKFTPRGGKVEVILDDTDGMVETRVVDNGQGIAQEDFPRLFKKFGVLGRDHTIISTAQQGTGLGLYVCKTIVELHEGKIWAKSEGEGKGATFGFSLKKQDLRL